MGQLALILRAAPATEVSVEKMKKVKKTVTAEMAVPEKKRKGTNDSLQTRFLKCYDSTGLPRRIEKLAFHERLERLIDNFTLISLYLRLKNFHGV